MEPVDLRDQRVMWAFWVACALAAVGAVAPFVSTAGGHNRMAGVMFPFGVAAVALAIDALRYHRGRSLAAILYFIAGMAIVYGILGMLAVPLRLAVLGTCPAGTVQCPVGSEPGLSSGESSGFSIAIFCGVLAIFIGFYGLLVLYRRGTAATRRRGSLWPAQPPTTTDSGQAAADGAPAPAKAHADIKVEAHSEPKELTAHKQAEELAAPAEPKELPPPA